MIARIFKILGLSLGGILLLLFIFPYLFPNLVTEQVKKWANRHIAGELNYSNASVSFFRHFPSLTLTLHDFSLKGSQPFAMDTLVASREIGVGVDVTALLFKKSLIINKIFLTNAYMNVQVNERGEANYNVYQSAGAGKAKSTDPGDGSLKIERIEISNSHLIYNDRSLPLLLNARGFNYTGKGDLSAAIFQLRTKASIDSLDFYLDNEPYILDKQVNARLVTKINTGSLAFVFERNKLNINKLPLEFTGKLDFLDNGYDMDFNVRSGQTPLYDLITALPPAYNTWLQKAAVKGTAEISTTLKGQYVVSENKMPDLRFSMKLQDGYLAYDKAPFPVSALLMDLDIQMPALNADSMLVNMDTLSFKLDQDYFRAAFLTTGAAQPAMNIKADIQASMDLARLDRTLGLHSIDLAGLCKIAGSLNGRYVRGGAMAGWKPLEFPLADLSVSWQKGQISTPGYPHPVRDIQVVSNIKNTSNGLQGLEVTVQPASFVFEGTPVHLTASLKNFDDVEYDISLNGELDFNKLYRVFIQEGPAVTGFAKADLHLQGKQSDAANGQYQNLRNEGSLDLRQIAVSSEYFPLPFIIKEGLFHFKQDKLYFNRFLAGYGSSDLGMDGYLQNVINYLLSDKEKLRGSFTLDAGFININELMAFGTTTPGKDKVADGTTGSTEAPLGAGRSGEAAGHSGNAATSELAQTDSLTKAVLSGYVTRVTADSTGVVMIPPDLDLQIDARAAKVAFQELSLQEVKGSLKINDGEAALTETGFNLIGCKVAMSAHYSSRTPKSAGFEYHIKADDFDVERAYREVGLFREMAPSAATAKGIISLDYHLAGQLNADMYPVFPSLTGGGVLSVKDVQIKGFKLFGAVSRNTGESSLKDPRFKAVELKTTIKNNIITLERTRMKVAGFRPRIEGQTSFDGRLNLQMRLGLPPLGIIGIPIKVTGTQDNPVIKLGKKTEDLTEEEEVPVSGTTTPMNEATPMNDSLNGKARKPIKSISNPTTKKVFQIQSIKSFLNGNLSGCLLHEVVNSKNKRAYNCPFRG